MDLQVAAGYQLFIDQAIHLSRRGNEIAIQCDTAEDATVLYDWLESLGQTCRGDVNGDSKRPRTLDKFHYHEISDRCHVVCSMIDDFILGHPACDEQMTAWAEVAQQQLCNVMNAAAIEELRDFPGECRNCNDMAGGCVVCNPSAFPCGDSGSTRQG